MFVFGASTYDQIVHNHSLIYEPFKTTFLLKVYRAPFFHLYEKDEYGYLTWLCIQRKPFRTAVRTYSSIRDDVDGDSCKICFQRQSCVLIQPCNHLGMCNICSFKTFRMRFFKNKSITKRIEHKVFHCPFCSSRISSLSYVFHV
jgi:hypothetical protein